MDAESFEGQIVEERPNLFIRLFRGDVSLPVTYWVFGVLIGGLGSSIVTEVVEFNYVHLAATWFGSLLVKGVYWCLLAYSVFILIAVWRSAGNYQGKQVWAGLARVVVALSFASVAGGAAVGLQEGSDPEAALQANLRVINKGLPTMVEAGLRWDSVSLEGDDVAYDYTLVNWLRSELDVPRYEAELLPGIKTQTCADTYARALLDDGREIVFSMRDREGKLLARVVVAGSHCQ